MVRYRSEPCLLVNAGSNTCVHEEVDGDTLDGDTRRHGSNRCRYIALEGKDSKYKLPKTLQEWKVVTSAAQKPVAIVALLNELAPAKTLVFTSSVDATHRLVTLLKACACLSGQVGEYSSLVSDKQRTKALSQFRDGPLRCVSTSC
jgi:ATP-dependent RNA helicase DDX51/DBP6